MKENQKKTLNALANMSFDEAEGIWNKVGDALIKKSMLNSLNEVRQFSEIPGHEIVELGKPEVDSFIAMVVDLRNSTNHLMEIYTKGKISQLQRVFYETSALLPVLAMTISWEKGKVTEYLGDGVLALFNSSGNKDAAIYSAHDAGRDCIYAVESIINPLLEKRYSLPGLKIGVGLAMSQAVVTLIGLETYMQPKAFGECVFRATKLAIGFNEIYTDKAIRYSWPTSKGGKISFTQKKFGDIDAFLVNNQS
jgi:class 3 adenylate cyclase